MIKFIHSGDIHLGLRFSNVSFGGEKGKTRRLELWQSFRRFISYGIENKVDLILLTGDIFEKDLVTLSDVKRLRDILASAKDQKVFIIAGNHDNLGKDSLYNKVKFSDNVYIFNSENIHSVELKELNLKVSGISWDNYSGDALNKIDDIVIDKMQKNILLIHGDIYGDSKYMTIDLKTLKSLNFDYIALGHIHKPEIISDNIAYCGSLEPLDFGELGERGFILGEIESDTNIEFVPFSSRRFKIHEIHVENYHSYEYIFNKIMEISSEGKDKDLYRIILIGNMSLDIDKDLLTQDLLQEFYHLEMHFNTSNIDIDDIKAKNKDNVIGKYIESFTQEEREDPIYSKALEIGIKTLLEGGK